jgi:hypothetical protein
MSLVLQSAALAILKDVDQLLRLYGQITEADVPPRVRNLFARIRHIRSPHGPLVVLEQTLRNRGRVSFLFDHHVLAFKNFEDQILDLELFVDPEQAMPRSGPGSDAVDVLPWMGPSGDQIDVFLEGFEQRIQQLENTCETILLELKGGTKPPANTQATQLSVSAPSQQSIHSQVSPNLLGPMSPNPFVQLPIPMISPLTSPFSHPMHGPPFQGHSPLPTPIQSPYIHAANYMQLPPVASLFNLADLPPIDLSASRTLANLPSSTSASLSAQAPTKRLDKKKKSKTVAEKRVQELIDAQYGNPVAAGVKRKRILQDHSLSTGIPQHVSERSLAPRTPPPTYEAPDSPKLGPVNPPDEVAGHTDDNVNPTVWSSLDDLVDALPQPQTSNQIVKGKGKQRVEFDTEPQWDTASSVHTGSTAGTTSSSADSIREGSIFSTASRERTYDEGTCTMLVKATNHPHAYGGPGGAAGKAVPFPVTHLEIRRTGQGGIVIVSRTTNGQEMADNLYISRLNENAKPFMEHIDVVEATKMSIGRVPSHGKSPQIHGIQKRYAGDDMEMANAHGSTEPSIVAIVFFAPHPSHHPQYAFSTYQDAWDFVSATSSTHELHMDPEWISQLSLVCSASVTSIKSALTHGNVEESGLVTVQVWERDTQSAPKPSTGLTIGHKQDSSRRGTSGPKTTDRFVRLFRNKSPLANAPIPPATASSTAGRTATLNIHVNAIVLDVDCKFLKPPETEKRSGKVTFAFRDLGVSAGPAQQGLSGVLRGMKYLKVAFRDDEEKREFLHEAGFGS